ncbi:hypothetical protein MKP08_04375 [Erythrobacter sp. LQ02-29]|uniref:hypothetical protein n=1 Tax=Erythrobacter sp. LQ02-29 TaxID=2920384 RepID=UPI001F4EF87D|nr:hypothetical protein [Erythrobacter sp. LQ02-29]MCP9221983.1 hypothetical protein [Erythrobacter sp. LQ02-29]
MTAQQDTAPSFAHTGPSLLDRLRFGKIGARRRTAASATIPAHPLFSAFVAIWFAALFGIGVMLLPIALLEALVVRLGIDSVIPAAAPPLSDTAHLLLALAFAAVGALLGLVLARMVASQEPARAPAPHPRKAADRHRDAPVKRPISAIEELGEEGLGPVRDIVPARHERPAERQTATDDAGDFEPLPASGRGELAIPSFLRAPLSLDPEFAPFDPDTSFELAQTGLWRPVTDTPAPAPAMDRAAEEPARHSLPEVEPPLAQVPLEDLGWPAMLERFAQALSGAGERPQPRTDERLRAELARAGNAIGAWPPRRSVPLDALENSDEIPSDPAETERALRRAIERLGRLSGAA